MFTMTDALTTERPDIFSFRDARSYLEALCHWKRDNERGFSFRRLVQLADLGSPGYIQTYIAGKRNLTRRTAEKLAEALRLTTDESDFFVLLVAFTQADDDREKSRWYEQMIAVSVRHGTGALDAARLAYFTDWYLPAIHTMASLPEFRADPQVIARRLEPNIDPRDARRALDVLCDLGILHIRKDGGADVCEPVLEVPEELRSMWVREYHRSMIRLSERALESWSRDLRHIGALTVTVPELHLKEVYGWVEAFRHDLFRRILALHDESKPGRVVQFNFQGFPLTHAENEQNRSGR